MNTKCSKKGDARTMEGGYDALAAAVVGQAISDYYYALLRTRMRDDPVKQEEKHRLERFFGSQKFMLFSNVDGIRLMRKIRDEAENALQDRNLSGRQIDLSA